MHDGHAAVLAVDAQEDVLELRPRERVDRRERLVEQQDLRPRDERARDRDPLLHAARELPRVLARDAAQAELLEGRLGGREPLRARRLRAAEREHHVANDVQPRKERPAVVLKDDGDLPRRPEHRARVEEHGAGARARQPADDAEERRLPAAGRPDDREQLAAPDLERHVAQRGWPILGVALRQAVDAQHDARVSLLLDRSRHRISDPTHRRLRSATRGRGVRRRGRAGSGRTRAGRGRGFRRRPPRC